jgi:hypothetical protein
MKNSLTITFAVSALMACILSFVGCTETTGNNNSSENRNPTETKNQTPTRAEIVPENTTMAKAIEQHLADNFGRPGFKTSWYDSIKGISVQGDTVLEVGREHLNRIKL